MASHRLRFIGHGCIGSVLGLGSSIGSLHLAIVQDPIRDTSISAWVHTLPKIAPQYVTNDSTCVTLSGKQLGSHLSPATTTCYSLVNASRAKCCEGWHQCQTSPALRPALTSLAAALGKPPARPEQEVGLGVGLRALLGLGWGLFMLGDRRRRRHKSCSCSGSGSGSRLGLMARVKLKVRVGNRLGLGLG